MALLSVGTYSGNLTPITPDPSSMTWGLQDISDSDAGRVHDENNTMYKNRTSQKRKLKLIWTGLTPAQASTILTAFNPEYFYVGYTDAMTNTYQIREFYCGDRTAPVWIWTANNKRYETVSFDIIER